jgi:DDE superfamily endonuclease
MQRPGGRSSNQLSVNSGHKRFHCLAYQTITAPDGLILHVYGPDEGRRHDMTLYAKKDMDFIQSENLLIAGKQSCFYGDPAYVLMPWMQVGIPAVTATPDEAAYNSLMSSSRVAVEWSFKDIEQNFTIMDFKQNLKVREAPVAVLYISSVLLWKCKQCFGHGVEVSAAFSCSAPTIEKYVTYRFYMIEHQ